jgi:hypothetical protein
LLLAALGTRPGIRSGLVPRSVALLAMAGPFMTGWPPALSIAMSLALSISLAIMARRPRPALTLIGLRRLLCAFGNRSGSDRSVCGCRIACRRCRGGRLVALAPVAVLVAAMAAMRTPLAMFDAARPPNLDQFRFGGCRSFGRDFGNALACIG